MSKRKKIPKFIKEIVYTRQNGLCACCTKRAKQLHHIVAFCISKDQGILKSKDFIYLCNKHHELFHAGDPDTYQCIYEYAWYLQKGSMPEQKDLHEICSEVHKNIHKNSNR